MSQVKFMLRHHFYLGKLWYISVLLYLSTEWCEKDTLKAGSRKSWVTFLPKNPPPLISASHFLHGNHVPNVTGQYRLLSSVPHQPNLKDVWIYLHKFSLFLAVQFSSVIQSCPALCGPMDCSTPGLPVHHPGFTKIHVHWVGDAIQPSHPVVPFSYRLQSFPESGSFPMSQFFASGGQSIGLSTSTSVLPMNIQDLSLLGWTAWISLQSKGFSRVFSNTTVQKHEFFSAQLSF